LGKFNWNFGGNFAHKLLSMMHVGLGRTHPLHIEYIHLGACLSFIQDIMTEAILSHPKLPLPRKIALVKALGKIIWIQNDLMAKWHIREGVDEFAVNDDDIEVEEEGYLHGKKIVSESDEEEADPGTPTGGAPTGTCPFSGMAKGMEDMKIEEHDFAQKN
jgi:Protoglobin